MDRQGQKPQRPSLLAGTDANPAAPVSAPRILADMEGRPKPAPARAKRSKLLPALIAVLALALLGVWLLPGLRGDGDRASVATLPRPEDAGGSADADVRSGAPRGTTTQPPAVTDATGTTAALIVDEPQTPPAATEAKADGASAVAAAGKGDTDQGDPDPLREAFTAKPAPAAAPTRPAPRHLPGVDVRGSHDPDVDLLAALLGQIGGLRSEPRPGERIAFRPVPEDPFPFAAADEPAESAAVPVAERMRRCPAANTAAGIRCREKICAELRGRDSACPAPTPARD